MLKPRTLLPFGSNDHLRDEYKTRNTLVAVGRKFPPLPRMFSQENWHISNKGTFSLLTYYKLNSVSSNFINIKKSAKGFFIVGQIQSLITDLQISNETSSICWLWTSPKLILKKDPLRNPWIKLQKVCIQWIFLGSTNFHKKKGTEPVNLSHSLNASK